MSAAHRTILVTAIVLAVGYAWLRGAFISTATAGSDPILPVDARVATFAMGCFWTAASTFDGVPGVVSVVAGYTGGTVPGPSYEQVLAGATGHAEAVQVWFDPQRVDYAHLLDRFWHHVDPFSAHRQFCDLGDQYRPAVFVHDAEQRVAAESSRHAWEARFGRPIPVAVTDAGPFYRAEGYHQDYARRHPLQYRFYRWSCGTDEQLRAIWGRDRP